MLYAGVDAGSRTIKVVLMDGDGMKIAASRIVDQGVRQARLALEAFDKALLDAGAKNSDVEKIVATGYGRDALEWADTTVTEITCQASGVKHRYPGVRTIVDIGGQDSKLIRLDKNGSVRDFAMNDRCAAGTGRFLEIVAERLGISLANLGAAAERADRPSAISSMCVVFAETEIIGLLSSEGSPENIAAGVQLSIVKRIVSMAGSRIEGPVIFTGGVAHSPSMTSALSGALGCPVKAADDPQLTCAIGAAVIAVGVGSKSLSAV